MKEQIRAGSAEYDFVANLFTSTLNGRVPQKQKGAANKNNNFGLALGPGRFAASNIFAPGFGVANMNMMYPPPAALAAPGFGVGGAGQVIKIEKIYNCVIYEKFMNEFKRMLRKYRHL